MPLLDMTVDRLKSTISRAILTRPIVAFKARKAAEQDNARNAETFFDWLLNERMDDFKHEVFVGLDSILQYGFCVFKVFWDFKSNVVTRRINWDDLPNEFRELVPNITPRIANELFFDQGKIVVDKKRMRKLIGENLDAIRKGFAGRYGLDEDEKQDPSRVATGKVE